MFFVFAVTAAFSQAQAQTLISITNSWRYNQSGVDLSGQFQQVGFDDSAWPSGQGLLGLETTSPYPYPYPIRTPLTVGGGRITYYFRTHFNFPTNPVGLFLALTNYVDDGLVLYLNGQEAGRIRMQGGPITAATPAALAPIEGVPVTLVIPATNVVQGDNVLAVEVHQSASTSSDVVFGMAATIATNKPLPDLIVWGPSVNPRLETHTFAAGDCEVGEGCATVGTRRLLRFNTETRNIGAGDLVLGSPVNNPLFVYAPCHAHYHFLGFAAYRLFDSNGVLIALGNKVGFCLEDYPGARWDPGAMTNEIFDCDYQGIQHGWGDIYSSPLPCQYVDVTSVPGGTYTLELEINPDHKILESNFSNNVTRTTIVISPPCTTPPSNDVFTAAHVISYRVATLLADTACATREGSEPDHAGTGGTHSVWYRWTAPASGSVTISTEGSNFDTVLGVYTGSNLSSLSLVANNDDVVTGSTLWSRVTFSAVAGQTYQIAVDGYAGASGDAVLNVNPNGNDAFANCLSLTGAVGTVGGFTAAATREAGEPAHAGNTGGHSLWYCWTAPSTGPMIFDTFGSKFDTLLGIYTGSSVSTLTFIAASDDAGGLFTSRVTFNSTAGVTYRIAIDGKGGASGISMLNWRPQPQFTLLTQLTGTLQFNFTGLPGDRCVIEASSNLVNWTEWRRVTNSTGNISLMDATDAAQRFYRVHTE